MKLVTNEPINLRHSTIRAFTLVEMMTVLGVFSLVMAAMVATQLFGLRTFTLGEAKLSASTGSLKLLDQIRDQIREAQELQIGNCSGAGPSSFTPIPDTSIAQGNALEIFPTTNPMPYTIYYLDTNSSDSSKLLSHYNLKQYTYGVSTNSSGIVSTNGATWTMASYITNQIIFFAEDYLGNPLTNNLAINRVYGMRLQFSQWEFSTATGTNLYSNYQLQTHVTRRFIGKSSN
jgi:prepilin-type N-terminal cleavage/methylation domain-containing protein